jgi:hypothetical protein
MLNEAIDEVGSSTKKRRDLGRAAVPRAQPYDLWRSTQKNASLLKIRIFRDDDQLVFLCIFPDFSIARGTETAITHMLRSREQVFKQKDQARGKIFAASLGNRFQLALAIRGERKAGADIFLGKVREVRQNFAVTHPAGEVFQYIVDSNAKAANAGPATTLAGLNRYVSRIVHSCHFTRKALLRKSKKNLGGPLG